MAFSLFSAKNRMINLVLNDHSIRYVELKQVNPPTAHKWNERFLPPGIISNGKITDIDSLSSILEECIEEWKIQRRQVRFIVPDPLVIIRKVTVPGDIKEDEMKGYLYLELGSSIHLPFEEPVFDYHQIADNDKTKDLLLFAAPEEYVMQYSELFSKLKLNPVAADISPLSLYRLYYHLDQTSTNEVLFTVQFDITSATLSIIEEGVPLVMRHFPIPFDIGQWDIKYGFQESMDINYTGDREELELQLDDIIKEISMLLDFYRYSLRNNKRDVTKFMLTGDHPSLDRIYQELKERYDAPVELLSQAMKFIDKTASVPVNHLLPLGLALKEVK